MAIRVTSRVSLLSESPSPVRLRLTLPYGVHQPQCVSRRYLSICSHSVFEPLRTELPHVWHWDSDVNTLCYSLRKTNKKTEPIDSMTEGHLNRYGFVFSCLHFAAHCLSVASTSNDASRSSALVCYAENPSSFNALTDIDNLSQKEIFFENDRNFVFCWRWKQKIHSGICPVLSLRSKHS